MRCKNCSSENPDTAKFCIQCGASLKNICKKCGHQNLGEATFCSECGAKLQKNDLGSSIKPSGVESRQLTILFCDIVDFSAISELLDPEDLHDFVRLYQETCAEAIIQFGGYLAKYLGDGLLIYFGYPLAHEDDAERAAKAGLRILAAISELADFDTKFHQSLRIRIGIHTGQVMAGEMGVEGARETMAVLGETPNIASRLQDIASPNTVVISSTTFKLVQGLFDCKDLGMKTLKGVSNQLQVYQVLGESNLINRFERSNKKGLTPFVGRNIELELLLERWDTVRAGSGQVVMISGEAGIGKSRLVQVFKECLSEEQYLKIESHCSPYYQNSALYSIIEYLKRQFFDDDRVSEGEFSRLEEALLKHDFSLDKMIPLLAPLLSMPIPDRYSSHNQTPEMQKRKTMETLLTWVLAESEEQPVLRIIEDLHWVDPSTLDYLGLLIDQLQGSNILVLLTFRPEFHPPWLIGPNITHIALNRLTSIQMEEMVNTMSKDNKFSSELAKQIVVRADGVPLFVEELFKMITESELLKEEDSGNKIMDSERISEIPMTLRDLLMARLDNLGTAKELAQLGATIGREFRYDLIKAVSSLDEDVLNNQLNMLLESELLSQRGLSPNISYFFKHYLIQETAYQSMLKRKRQGYHKKIAKILEEDFPEILDTQPELIANHFTIADQYERAVRYWHSAGQRAIKRSNHLEAVNHLNVGLRILNALPENQEKDQMELSFLTLLGTALRVTKGFASPEVQSVYSKAREVSKRVSDIPKLLPVLRGLCGYYIARAEFATAYELGKQCLNLAENAKSSEHLLQAHYILGAALFCTGEFALAEKQSVKGLSLYSPDHHSSEVLLYGQDPGVACMFWAAWSLWFLGYPDQALSKGKESLALAKKLSHPYSLAIANDLLASVYQFRGEPELAYESALEAITISKENGYELFLEMGCLIKGWALFKQGEKIEGLSIMKESYDKWIKTGAKIFCSYWLAFLTEAFLRMDEIQDGLDLLDSVLDNENNNEETFYRAEFYRLRGELLLARFPKAQSKTEICFRKAVDIAHKQNNKSIELRSIMSLGNLLHKQKKDKEAFKTLSKSYNWFTEGFDTSDLRKAKSMLDKLS